MIQDLQQQINELRQQLVQSQIPVGTILSFVGNDPPNGWLLCDGSFLDAIQHPEYTNLARLLGNTFGGNYILPDLRGRTIIGSGHGNHLSNRQLGTNVGSETHRLTINEMPDHNHGGQTGTENVQIWYNIHGGTFFSPQSNGWFLSSWNNNNGGKPTHIHSIPSQGNNQEHNNIQPSLVLNYIIKY